MAALMRLVLKEIVSPEDVVKWIKGKPIEGELQKALQEYESMKSDFVPEVLNILREYTLHILQNGVAESPVKTPSQANALLKHEKPPERPTNGKARRSNLFPCGKIQNREGNDQASKGQPNSQQDSCEEAAGHECQHVSPHDHSHYRLSEQGKTKNSWCEEASKSKHKDSIQNSEKSDNLDQSSSFLSFPSSVDDSVVAGSTDSSYYSCSGSGFKSKDAASTSNSFLSTPHRDNSNSFHTKRQSKNNGKTGGHFQSPNAHSTPHRRRSNGRPTPSSSFSLGDFLVPGDQGRGQGRQDSTTDTSSDFSAIQDGGSGRDGKGGKKKKKKQRNSKQGEANGNGLQKSSATSFPKYGVEDFPPVSPSSAAVVGGTGSSSPHFSQQTCSSSPVMAELRARVVVHSYSSVAAPFTAKPSPAAALDFTADGSTKPLRSSFTNAATDQSFDHVKGQPSAWVKFEPKSFDTTSSQDCPSFKTKPAQEVCSTNCEKENRNAALSLWGKTVSRDYYGNKVDLLGEKKPPVRVALTSVKATNKKADGSPFSPKPTPETDVSLFETNNSSRKVPDSLEFPALPDKNSEQKGKEQDVADATASSLPGNCISPVRQMRLQDSGDHFKSPSKVRTTWQMANDSPSIPCTPDKPSMKTFGRSMSIIKLVKASPLDVTHRPALGLFIRLYSACLDEHLFPNLSTELYFLTQLLISQTSEDELLNQEEDLVDDPEEKNLFQTIHNIVYFAVGVLERQSDLLKQLDRSTLRLLSENERVGDFSPKLQQEMKSAFDGLEEHSNSSIHSASMAVVSFQAETNNRRNFPDDKSFHRFKRQRDTFFHVKKEWEKHVGHGWTLEGACGDRIRAMFETPDLASNLHFTRLFVSQLIMSCKNEEMISTKTGHKDISELISLKSANPEKFNKLQERLMKPASCGSPCPTVTFPGHQQFFYDFLVVANSAHFYNHVAHILVSRIDELNQMYFHASPDNSRIISDKDPHQEQEEREEESAAFCSALLTLRLMARFLGFLHHLPYSGIERLPKHLQHDNIALRNKLAPSWDISGYVWRAADQGHLALTIPWVAEYLAMMDAAAPRTDHVARLLAQLRQLLSAVWAELKESGFTYSLLLVIITLGWLFDQPCMPAGHFFTEPQTDEDKLQAMAVAPEAKKCSDLVSQDLFYSCCPYFGEMRYLLTEHSLGSRAKTEVRKVNPLPPVPMSTTSKISFTSSNSIKSTQSKLMQNFFHMNSKSMHRLVDFVADRISSNFIKYLRYEALPAALSRCEGESLAMSLVPEIAQRLFTETRDSMIRDMESRCMEEVKGSLQLLLPRTTHKAVVTVAVHMSCALTAVKVNRWINSHVEYDAFHNVLAARVVQKPKSPTPHREGSQSSPITQTKTKAVRTTDHADSKGSNLTPSFLMNSEESEMCHDQTKSQIVNTIEASYSHIDADKNRVASLPMAGDVECGLASAVSDSSSCRTASNSVSRLESVSPSVSLKEVSLLDNSKKQVAWALPASGRVIEKKSVMTSLSSDSNAQSPTPQSSQVLPLDHKLSSRLTESKCSWTSAESSTVTPAGSVSRDSSSKSGTVRSRAVLPANTNASTVSSTLSVTTPNWKPLLTSPVPAGTICGTVESSKGEKWPTRLNAECYDGNSITRLSFRRLGDGGGDASGMLDGGSSSLGGRKTQAVDDDFMCYMLRDMQDLLWTLKLDVDLEEDPITPEELRSQLQRVLHTLTIRRYDEHTPQTFPFMAQILTQVAAAVVFCQPALWSEESCSLLLELWAMLDGSSQELPFLCSRVILGYLQDACNLQLSLCLYAKLLNTMIERNFFTLAQIQEAFSESEFQMFTSDIQGITKHLIDPHRMLRLDLQIGS